MAKTEGASDGFSGWLTRLARTGALEIHVVEPGTSPQVATVEHRRCVFAGILHSRDDLARICGVDGAAANDAELILRAYLRLGEHVLSNVKGIFAFAVWDGETLLCVRDRLGIYPLFTADADGDLLVSTSIRALVTQPGVSTAVNLPVLVDHIRHRWLNEEETFFEAVRRVPAGHALTYRRGAARVFRYWDPAPPDQPVSWIGTDEVDHFDHLLQTAVDRYIRPGETGVFLSGGLDSVSVAALASRSEGADPLALSLVFPDPPANEEEVQRAVAARLGLSQVMLPWPDAVGPRGLMPAALELTGHLTAPLINLWAPAYDELGRRGRNRGCRVIVTGTGGDEWLGVSPYYAADLMRRLDVRGLASLLRSLMRSYPLSPHRHLRNVFWEFGARPLLRRGAIRLAPGPLAARKRRRAPAAIPPWLVPDPQLRRALVERELDAYSRSLKPMRRLSVGHPAVYLEQMRTALSHPLVSLEFEEVFDQGRRLGVAILHPFLDSDLVEFLYRTPPELLNRGGRSKGLVRDAVSRRLPQLGFDVQQKVVATNFARALIGREMPQAWREAGGVPALIEAGIVDGRRLDGVLDRLETSPTLPDRFKLWDLLSSDFWFRSQGSKGALEWTRVHGSP